MANIGLCGFETGDFSTEQVIASSGSVALNTVTTRTGVYSLRVNPTLTGTGSVRIGSSASNNKPSVYYTFWFRYAARPASGEEILFQVLNTSALAKLEARLDSTGAIILYSFSPTLLGASQPIAQDTWHRIDVFAATGTTAAYEMRINGVTVLTGSANLSSSNNHSIRVGKHEDTNGQTVDYYFDDVWLDDAAYPADFGIKIRRPSANGSVMQWTGGTGASDYTQIDELPFGVTDYVQSVNAGDVALFDLESCAAAGITGTIRCVLVHAVAREVASGTGEFGMRLRSGASDADGPLGDYTTTSTHRSLIVETNPATGTAWTIQTADAIEVGVVDGAGGAVRQRLQWLAASIAFSPMTTTAIPTIVLSIYERNNA